MYRIVCVLSTAITNRFNLRVYIKVNAECIAHGRVGSIRICTNCREYVFQSTFCSVYIGLECFFVFGQKET